MKRRLKGTKLVYKVGENPCPKGAQVIIAEFSDPQSLTMCPYRAPIRVGSLSCMRCDSYAGKQNYGINTGGTNQFGGIDHTHEIYCKEKLK